MDIRVVAQTQISAISKDVANLVVQIVSHPEGREVGRRIVAALAGISGGQEVGTTLIVLIGHIIDRPVGAKEIAAPDVAGSGPCIGCLAGQNLQATRGRLFGVAINIDSFEVIVFDNYKGVRSAA